MFSGLTLRKLAVFIFLFATSLIWNVDRWATAVKQEEAVAMTISARAEVAARQGPEPRVWLEAPATAVAGQSITARLMAENVENLGGFEVVLRYDPARLALRTAVPNPALAQGRELLNLGYVRRADGLVWGVASCPVAHCAAADYQTALRDVTGASGRLELASLEFILRGQEPAALDLAEILLLDTSGRPLLTSAGYAADAASQATPAVAALDLSGNRVVNDADAYLVVDVWRDLVGNGRCLHPNVTHYDVNASGCLNTADVQTILAAWGQPVGALPDPFDGSQSPQATFTVTSSQDQSDLNPGNGVCLTSAGTCTLRAALEEANARTGPDIINFDIRNTDGSCPGLVTIYPGSTLTLDAYDNASLTMNGYSQCNASPNSQWVAGNAVIKIEIRGSNAAYQFGLHVLSPNNLIKGLAVYNWHRQIQVMGTRAHDNALEGNFIGTNAANTFIQSAAGIEGDGLRIQLAANNNHVGATNPAARNIIAGNDQDGLDLEDADANVVVNNYIGLKQTGDAALMNIADGVDVAEGAANNWIGGLNPGERNVISGNGRDGIEISHQVGTQGNHFAGNFIGLNPGGTAVIANRDRGITFEDEVNANHIYRNVIVGSGGDGVRLYTAFNNQLYDNFIGVAPIGLGPLDVVPVPGAESGLLALPNGSLPARDKGLSGVYMTAGSQGNVVAHNIIAYHPEYGIYLDAVKGYLSYGTCQTYHNTFSQNSLYDNAAQGIRLRAGVCDDGLTYYPNEGIAIPQITAATTSQVTGNTCAGCLVELFLSDKTVVDSPSDNFGEGKLYLAQATANGSGNFVIPITGVAAGAIVTAHTTDGAGNTSEFARNVKVLASVPATNTPTATTTSTATNTPTATSTSTATNTPTATSTSTATNTPTATSTSTATSTPTATSTSTATPTSTAVTLDYFIFLPLVRR